MRIALINTRADAVGGSQVHVRDLATEIIRRGHQACVFVGGTGPVLDFLAAANVPFHSLATMQRNVSVGRDLAAFKELKTAIAEYEPDLISTHTSKAGMLGRIVSRDLGIPSLFTAHGWNFADGINPIIRAGRIGLEKIAAGWCQRIITVSECDRQLALRYRVTSADKVMTIHNGMPDVKPAFRADPSRNPVRIVMIARFEQQKDHETLLAALSALKHLAWDLELIGDGPNAAKIKAQVTSLGLSDRVQFPGAVNDVKERLARAQLFALISNWEGLPRSIIEAMRAGLPVVGSDVGGTSELVDEGRTGFLIPRSDVKTLQERLTRLLSDAQLRAEMGRNARQRYENSFTFERMFEQTFDIYRQVIGETGMAQPKRQPLPGRRRVVHVVESFGAGTAAIVSEMTNGMRDFQHVIIHGSRAESPPPSRELLGAGTTLILWRRARREVRPLADLLALCELVKLLRRQPRVDLIHGHSAKGGALARVAALMMGMRGKSIYTTHGSPILRKDVGTFRRGMFIAAERLLSKLGGTTVACSQSELAQLRSHGINGQLITNGVRTSAPVVNHQSQPAGNPLRVGIVGRLVPQKDPAFVSQILDAAGVNRGFEIEWIGSAEGSDQLDSRVQRKGWMPEQQVGEEIAGFDVYLSTSRWEGLSLSVLKAMVMGKPLVLRRCVGNVDAVTEGDNGFLFDDAATAAERLSELASNAQLRQQMGRRSREIALQNFTADQMLDQYRALYDECTAREAQGVPSFAKDSDSRGSLPQATRGSKILLVLEASGGGAGRHVLDLAQRLIDYGCEVHLLYASGRLDRMFAEGVKRIGGLKTGLLKMDRHLGIGDIAAVLQTRRYASEHGPFDIIHGHAAKGGAVARLAGFGKRTPVFYTPHGFQLMDPGLSRISRYSYAAFEFLLSLNHRQIIAVSPEERRSVLRLGIAPERITLIPNGIDLDPIGETRSAARAAMNLSDDTIAIGFVGRLVKLKAVDVLLRAFAVASAAIPQARLVVVGSGPLGESLEALSNQLGVGEKVSWLGEQPARELMRGLDIFTLSSRKEGLPYVILEAMAAGLPVVATESCSVSMLLKSGVNGLVVPANNVDEFAHALLLLASDAEKRQSMGAAARLHAMQFSIDIMVQRTLEAYNRVAEQKRVAGPIPVDAPSERRRAA